MYLFAKTSLYANAEGKIVRQYINGDRPSKLKKRQVRGRRQACTVNKMGKMFFFFFFH